MRSSICLIHGFCNSLYDAVCLFFIYVNAARCAFGVVEHICIIEQLWDDFVFGEHDDHGVYVWVTVGIQVRHAIVEHFWDPVDLCQRHFLG